MFVPHASLHTRYGISPGSVSNTARYLGCELDTGQMLLSVGYFWMASNIVAGRRPEVVCHDVVERVCLRRWHGSEEVADL